MADKIVVCG